MARYEIKTGYDKCKRLVSLLELRKDSRDVVKLCDLRMLIMKEIGCDRLTLIKYIELVQELGFLKRLNRYQFRIIRDCMY